MTEDDFNFLLAVADWGWAPGVLEWIDHNHPGLVVETVAWLCEQVEDRKAYPDRPRVVRNMIAGPRKVVP